jgi:putative heme iron utilization protein
MSWVAAEDYRAAEPDPLTSSARGILAHMNGDHAESLLAYARSLAAIPDAESATMTSVDRYGFDMAVKTASGPRATRLAFPAPVTTASDVRAAMIAMAAEARLGP